MERKILIVSVIVLFGFMAVFTLISPYTAKTQLPLVVTTQATGDGWVQEEAVHYDENGKAFVYWVVPCETILGEGHKLQKFPVDFQEEEEKNGMVRIPKASWLGSIALSCSEPMRDGLDVRTE